MLLESRLRALMVEVEVQFQIETIAAANLVGYG
jgi:hypothetical protein